MHSRDKRRDVLFGAIVLLVLIADQVTKAWIRSNLAVGEVLFDAGVFEIIHVQNTGAAFGLFKGIPYVFIAVEIIAIIAILFLVIVMRSRWPFIDRWLVRSGIALVMAGTVGNFIDRVFYDGVVTDFINFRWWPVFNVADSAAVVGSIILAYAIIFMLKPEKQE
ncbi:MAG: signal peptidase II [Dehalococcoidales bacterium]|nr:signal peptidase II [Dehalococcoidales bacterium]